jgi:hypothetical protein
MPYIAVKCHKRRQQVIDNERVNVIILDVEFPPLRVGEKVCTIVAELCAARLPS